MHVIKPVDPSNLTINIKHNNTTVSTKEKLANTSQTKRFLHLLKRLLHLLPTKTYQSCYLSKILSEVFMKFDITYDSDPIIELTRKAHLIKTISCKTKIILQAKLYFYHVTNRKILNGKCKCHFEK